MIRVHAGTYAGPFTLPHSGTSAHPITLTTAGDGQVTLTSRYPTPACNTAGPAQNRTIKIKQGVDNWIIRGLNINGGIIAVGDGSKRVLAWNRDLMAHGNWATRRALPGRGNNNRSASPNAIPAMSRILGMPLDPNDHIQMIGNNITGQGIQMSMSRYGAIVNNQIHDIKCGTGPGVWLGNFSDGWTVTGNHVSNIPASTFKHFMCEGIRLANASNYNTIRNNLIDHLPNPCRAFTTDEDASWNTFDHNTARDSYIGFNDQMSGWGNVWDHNTSVNTPYGAMVLRAADGNLPVPSLNTSTYLARITCNTSIGPGLSLDVGGAKQVTFTSNLFDTVHLYDPVRRYWGSQGDKWNGSSNPPSSHPSLPRSYHGC